MMNIAHASTLPPPAPDAEHPLPALALDGALRALNAETFARACVAELKAQRIQWLAMQEASSNLQRFHIASDAIAAIDRVLKP